MVSKEGRAAGVLVAVVWRGCDAAATPSASPLLPLPSHLLSPFAAPLHLTPSSHHPTPPCWALRRGGCEGVGRGAGGCVVSERGGGRGEEDQGGQWWGSRGVVEEEGLW